MVTPMPKRMSSGLPWNSMPRPRSSCIVCPMSSHISENWCTGASAGCTPTSAGGSLKISQPPPASTWSQPKTSRSTSRRLSGSLVYSRTCAPVMAMDLLASGLQRRMLTGEQRQEHAPWRDVGDVRADSVADTRDDDALALFESFDRRFGNLVRGQPHELRQRVARLLVGEPGDVRELRLDRPRTQDAHRHAGALELGAGRLGVREHERLRTAVTRLPGERLEGRGRRDIQHGTASALDHARHEQAAEMHDRF